MCLPQALAQTLYVFLSLSGRTAGWQTCVMCKCKIPISQWRSHCLRKWVSVFVEAPVRDALTHTLAEWMTHTEVNHTYSRGFTLSRSKPPSLSPSRRKSNKQTDRRIILPPFAGPTASFTSRVSPTFAQLSLWEEPQGQMVLVFHFHQPQSVIRPIMISFVAWHHGNIWPLYFWFPFFSWLTSRSTNSLSLFLSQTHTHTDTQPHTPVPLSDSAHF